MNNKMNEERGFTLVSALVAAGISITVLTSFVTAFVALRGRQKTMTASAEANELIHSVRNAVFYGSSCNDVLANQPFSFNTAVTLSKPNEDALNPQVWLQENTQLGHLTPTSIRWIKADYIPGTDSPKEFLAELELVLEAPKFLTKKRIEVIVGSNDPGPDSKVHYCYQAVAVSVPEKSVCHHLGGIYDSSFTPPCRLTTVSVAADEATNVEASPSDPTTIDTSLLAKNVCGKLGSLDAVTGACSLTVTGAKLKFQTQYYTNPKSDPNATDIANQAAADLIMKSITSLKANGP